MRVNKLRAKLKAGEAALGTLVWGTHGRGVIYTLAAAGMDFVWICMEHSDYSLDTVTEMVAHAHAAGISPIVRIPDLHYEWVTRLLDSGCQSLILPHARSGEEVRRFIDLAKYHPAGRRGMAIYLGPSTSYEDVDPVQAMAHANANTLLGVLIETKEAVENVDEMLVPGIDVALVGHQDLAQSFGVPGDYRAPQLREATAKVAKLCKERGIAMAGAVNQPENMQSVVDSGAQFLLYGTDLILMRREAQRATDALAAYRKGKAA
jgi:2-keto-3-deoxy-L-rhamnonate aldolase RhmA